MSGDQFQVAVALMLDPELRLILIGEHAPNKEDKSDAIYKFYTQQSGISADRIAFMKVNGKMEDRTKKILKGRPEDAGSQDKKEDFFDQSVASVGQATNVVREVFKDAARTSDVRRAWLAHSGMDEAALARLVREWRVPLEKPMVVLWSRQSGALGGLHPEHDSSYTGLAQLVDRFSTADNTVVIVGDDPNMKIRGRYRFDFLTGADALKQSREEAKRSQRFNKALTLGEFWERSGLRGKPRTAQFAFFEYLRQLVPTLTHVGMRSGNLEAYAYMGHRVIYLEEKGRADSVRMDKLIGNDVKLKYKSVKLDRLPTRTGRALTEASLNMQTALTRLRNLYNTAFPAKDTKKAQAIRNQLTPEIVELLQKFHVDEQAIVQSPKPPYQRELHLYRLLKNNARLMQLLWNTSQRVQHFPAPPNLALPPLSGFSPLSLDFVSLVHRAGLSGTEEASMVSALALDLSKM
jgi:hypothetical protein